MGHIAKSFWVPSVTLRVGAGAVDTAALLLGADGRVRGDADMVFAGQPDHPSGAVRHEKATLTLALHEVEPEVERIVIAGSAAGGSLAAMAPDRAVVVTLLVTGARDESAVVFGEFFRESGGWKFGQVGKGYAAGLAGLVTEYGVEVAEEEPAAGRPEEPAAGPLEKPAPGRVEKPVTGPEVPQAAAPVGGPVPLTGVAKVPMHAPPPPGDHAGTPGASGTAGARGSAAGMEVVGTPVAPDPSVFPPAEREHRLLDGWEFGPVFEPFTVTGHGSDVITTDARVPAGPVLVEVAHQGGGYFAVVPLDRRNKDGLSLFSTTIPDYRGSTVTPAPEGRPLRLRLSGDNAWVARVKPVATARRLEGTLLGYGEEALLHMGGAADLRVDFKGSPGGGGCVSLWVHEVTGQAELTHVGRTLALNTSGPILQTIPIPEGPALLLLTAEGPWSLTVREVGF
ncbi:TerD family protein [Streptomyces flavochromogenes]|uniref:TerD family protein n=1 Tax=Streptomyces flavochromogenes TaxID=68199 RepID=UPI000B2F949F|nr:TerD family protein [Streptomyces flavochromogenes]